MNDLAIINTMTDNELQIMQEQIIAKRFALYNEKLKEAFDRIDKVEEKQSKTLEVAANMVRVKQAQEDYISQKVFGSMFTVSIGSRTLGKLFKAVGLAQKGYGKTTPYRHLVPKYAKSMANQEYQTWIWHYDNCLNFIEKWLAENGYYEEFYSKTTEKALESFIDNLFETYGR